MTIHRFTFANFEPALRAHPMVVVEFYGAHEGRPRGVRQFFETAAADHPEMTFGVVDTRTEPKLVQRFFPWSVPTLMVFRDGLRIYHGWEIELEPVFRDLLVTLAALPMDEVRRHLAALEG